MSGDGMNPPFKWFGGKRRVADYVWSRFGETGSYIEPFLGSGAVFVRSPGTVKYSVLNDKDCLVANFWRAAKREPEALAEYVSDISHEAELTARHVYICERLGSLAPRVMADPDYFDLRIAGYWFYAISQVIGDDFATGTGCWGVRTADDGTKELVDSRADKAVVGIVPKQRQWEKKKIKLEKAREITASIFKKLESAVILCGAWERAVTPVNFRQSGVYSIFLDPPYSSARNMAYRTDGDLRSGIMRWCRENGGREDRRVAVCGYDGEYNELQNSGWTMYAWKGANGFTATRKAGANENRSKERIWFSPHCLPDVSPGLFGGRA